MLPLELKVPPPLQLVTAVLLLWGIGYLFPKFGFELAYRGVIAVCLLVLGAAIAASGVLAFRIHKTTINPLKPERSSMVVRTGIYRFSRNPMYLGMLLVLVGVAVVVSNLMACMVVLPLFMGYMTRFQIIPEERALAAKFGADFAVYLREVGRWV